MQMYSQNHGTQNFISVWGPSVLKFFYPAGNYAFKVNNRNTRKKCEICLELTIKTPERHQWYRSGVLIVNFEHISHLVLVFLYLTLRR